MSGGVWVNARRCGAWEEHGSANVQWEVEKRRERY